MSSCERPYSLIAELTYRCPLRCVYCSNPLDLHRRRSELDLANWQRVLAEAEALGVMQVSFSGGEPLLRADLEELIAAAHRLGLYTNIATSGIPNGIDRLPALQHAGIDSIQISVQGIAEASSERIAGGSFHADKLAFAAMVKSLGMPLTLNVVLHRENLDHIASFIELAERLDADRLELANTQYQGWALLNRAALLPSRQQLENAREIATAARARLKGRMELLFVMPDYYSDRPKPCMAGWGRRFILIAPDGHALPCHGAHNLPGISDNSVREHSLQWIWQESPAFNLFRGEDWMPLPCRTCDQRNRDFGGCRCQAYALTGDAAATDPACALAPEHRMILAAREHAEAVQPVALQYRSMATPTEDRT
jgi:pyrroloquinoline quinone biosynthesis protein E